MQKKECITLNTSKPARESYLHSTHASLFKCYQCSEDKHNYEGYLLLMHRGPGQRIFPSHFHANNIPYSWDSGAPASAKKGQWCTCFRKKGVNLAIPLSTYSQNLSDLCDQLCDWAEGGGITGWSPDQASLHGVSPVIRLHSNSSSVHCQTWLT